MGIIEPPAARDTMSENNVISATANLEAQLPTAPSRVSYFKHLVDQTGVTQSVLEYRYPGDGTTDSPFVVDFLISDPYNPLAFPAGRKWAITAVQAISTLAVSFSSSAYSGAVASIMEEFHVSSEVSILGVSMFVLGFAVGPLLWAPLSEVYGRQRLFFVTYLALTAFSAGAAGSHSMAAFVVLRFLAGSFGSSPMTNAGGVIADMFIAEDRGIANGLFALAPFFGPAIGPVAGGFLGSAAGWRWVEGLIAAFCGVVWIANTFICPETYMPVLLRRRAEELASRTGKVYISKMDCGKPYVTIHARIMTSLSRPLILLFREPIVLFASLYMAIMYGTLFLCFAAFPIVFQQGRGWSPGVGGLAFIGLAVGMTIAIIGTIFDNKRYRRVAAASIRGVAPPEARLPPGIVGSILVPVGLFWFAWTTGDSIPWIVPIMGSAVFGAGLVLVFLPLTNYLIDTYVLYAASVLAASSILRSLFGVAFPLFTTYMYTALGTQWASSIPAFLSVGCLPFPLLFYKYGAKIRAKCKFAAEAEQYAAEASKSG